MKQPLLLVTLCLLMCHATATAQIGISAPGATTRTFGTPPGGEGSSYAKAIPVHATNWTSGLSFEFKYVQSRFPGCKAVNHVREQYTGKTYDIITFTSPNGAKRAVFFHYLQHS